jgi:hypothetical protein
MGDCQANDRDLCFGQQQKEFAMPGKSRMYLPGVPAHLAGNQEISRKSGTDHDFRLIFADFL